MPNDACAVLAHELAHVVVHEKARDLTYAAAELQVEGAAYFVCYALGLDTGRASLPYLRWYELKGESIAVQLPEIDRIAFRLLGEIDHALHGKCAR